MARQIKLVRGDTRPQPKVVIRNEDTRAEVSVVGAVATMFFRSLGDRVLRSTIVGTLLAGRELPDGTVDLAAPFNVPGAGGRVVFVWPVGALSVEAGDYEGEIKVAFADGTTQTVFDTLKFKLRDS